MNREILLYQKRLDFLFDQALLLQDEDGIDDLLKAEFVWYLCVRTSGYLETSVKMILLEHVRSMTHHQRIVDFANNWLRKSTPLRRKEILRLAGTFSKEWRDNLENAFDDDLAQSLGSLNVNRNAIAHGTDVDLTLIRLETYYDNAKKVVSLVNDQCPSQIEVTS